jgi:hypothetical protein
LVQAKDLPPSFHSLCGWRGEEKPRASVQVRQQKVQVLLERFEDDEALRAGTEKPPPGWLFRHAMGQSMVLDKAARVHRGALSAVSPGMVVTTGANFRTPGVGGLAASAIPVADQVAFPARAPFHRVRTRVCRAGPMAFVPAPSKVIPMTFLR